MLSRVADRFLREHGAGVGQRLLEHGKPFGHRRVGEAEHLVFAIHPTRPDAEREPTTGHPVDRDRRLDQYGGMAKRDGRDEDDEFEIGGIASQTGELDQGVRCRSDLGFLVVERHEVVVGERDRGQSALLREPGRLEHVLVET
ncbi:MAG TPA: hypothetical protein VFD97_03130 [Acidimicrobiia bacterium]|nr:hypothetical protein [Acidimicrobiia bacterium]